MQLELTSPCCLLLGLAQVEGEPCELGVTLQYPPIQLAAHSSNALVITGARADLAYQQAERFIQHHGLPPRGEIEIEYAIPSFMGLGSAALLGLSIAASYAALNGLPNGDTPSLAREAGLLGANGALEAQAFARGGLLLVGGGGAPVLCADVPPGGDERDWVWVMVLPRVPADTAATLEAGQREALHAAAPYLSAEIGQLTRELFAATTSDDIAGFARTLERLQALNDAALAQTGAPDPLGAHDRAILAVMREHGALVCGRAITGLGLYALVRGGGPSRAMRRALTDHLGIFGGNVMASIADNAGARLRSTMRKGTAHD
jgi:predicted sugar kinase